MKADRREFFSAACRLTWLGALAALILGQERKNRRLEMDPNRLALDPCAGCMKNQSCEEKARLAARRRLNPQSGVACSLRSSESTTFNPS